MTRPAPSPPLPDAYVVPGRGIYPEGIAFDPVSGALFTTSMLTGAVFRARPGRDDFALMSPAGAGGCLSSAGIAVDAERRRLFVCGGVTGAAWVRDVDSGALIGRYGTGLVAEPPKTVAPNAAAPSFVNDVALIGGDAYFTDSYHPVVYRLTDAALSGGADALEPWLRLEDTVIRYDDGHDVPSRFNLNGIVATPKGDHLLVNQTNTGKLFRITVATRAVIEIAGTGNPGGDGLMLIGDDGALSVDMTKPPALTRLTLSDDYSRYVVAGRYDAPGNVSPTASLIVDDRLLLTESQISDTLLTGAPEHLPFRVTAHPLSVIGL